MRYFAATAENYESVRAALDAALGFPNPSTGTITAIPPASEAIVGIDGRMLMAAADEQASGEYVAPVIADAVATGLIAELTAAEFVALMPPSPGQP